MSQPTLNSSFSGINFAGMNRGTRLSYMSLRAASGDNSVNEERLSAPSVHGGSSRGSLTMDQSSARLSQPDVRRFTLRHEAPAKRERLSQPTLMSGDYQPGRGQQRLSQPCLSTGKELNLPTMVFHSPSPPPIKHKRFSPAIHASQRDRLSQLDFGAKYRNFKESATTKFNRDRFSIPELETQNDLKLIAGTPKQRFSLDSQLTRSQDVTRSRLLPIASSPISEHQQTKLDEPTGIPGCMLKSPTKEGLGSVLVATATPILPAYERQLLSSELLSIKKSIGTGSTASKLPPISPIHTRERMSVPEIRNSSLRRLLDPPTRQRHSITGNLRQSIITPLKPLDFGKKSPKHLFEEALERFRRDEKEENRKNEMSNSETIVDIVDGPKHIQKHYSYTYENTDESSTLLRKISVSAIPKKKYLESNFDENEQVITTVIETDVPMIMASPKYTKKSSYSSDTPKWIRKYLENESPKVGRKTTINKKESRRNSRRKSSLESMEGDKVSDKVRSKSVGSSDRNPMVKNTVLQSESKNMKNTYVRIVSSSNAVRENKYEVKVENNWTDGNGLYDNECEDTDSDDSTSI
ncbi:uncharacterized protein LOC128879730 [Hylaeus volcanicus]|uniref:uncharacterized protein LOC128879730 n=1 Tax=Hylaeus volcanicus TaxID=313075 RepID=UPI0023B7896D|nr:uncharacterized protein LOC128879730 [Hylaeus volcanicus]